MRTANMKEADFKSLEVSGSRLAAELHQTCNFGPKNRWGE
jgi:hypothetical protein